jgi:RES domain-containing protein
LPVKNIEFPSAYLSTGSLDIAHLLPETLFRISSHSTGEPYFGRSGAKRFDAPEPNPKLFGACYLGKTLKVAMAESILHDEDPVNGKFVIATKMIENKFVIRFTGATLKVADLTGASLKKMGGNADLSGTANYEITQQWSLAIHQNPENYDGFQYMSRHLNDSVAVILFDRSGSKIKMASATKLVEYDGLIDAMNTLGIVGV